MAAILSPLSVSMGYRRELKTVFIGYISAHSTGKRQKLSKTAHRVKKVLRLLAERLIAKK